MDAVLITVLGICLLLFAIVVGLYERELRRMAHFLRHHECGSNERISVEFATRGIREVASAMNEELDTLRDAGIEQEKHQVAFRRDLSSLSHDIRTPLAGAQGYLQLYERSEDPDEQQRCLKEAAARLGVMRDLTDKLFEYAKAVDSDSPLTLDRVEVFPILAEVLAGMYPQFVERNWKPRIEFEDEDVVVLADAEALQRIFSNLLTNALRYGVSAPCIKQEYKAMENLLPNNRGETNSELSSNNPSSDSRKVNEVNGKLSSNSGAKINSKSLKNKPTNTPCVCVIAISNAVENPSLVDTEHLFDRFYQAESARTNDGSGLGLAIVASLAERMDGSVSARMDKGDTHEDNLCGGELSIELQLKIA